MAPKEFTAQNILLEIIEKTLDHARLQRRKATYDDYRETAWRIFPKEMRSMAQSFTRQGFVKWLKGGMRQVAGVADSPDVPTIQFDLLPGLPAPRYINVGSMEEPDLMRFEDLTADGMAQLIEIRNRVVERTIKKTEDISLKREWLLANRKKESDTIRVVLERMQDSLKTE